MLRLTSRRIFCTVCLTAMAIWYVLSTAIPISRLVFSHHALPVRPTSPAPRGTHRTPPPYSSKAALWSLSPRGPLETAIEDQREKGATGILLPFDADAILKKVNNMEMSETLQRQLMTYMKRVAVRRAGKYANLYAHIGPTLDVTDCDVHTPECSIFRRKEVQSVELPNDFMYKKCCDEHRQLQEALAAFTGMMRAAGVKPWATAGTLLGIVRERGTIIPWDTDVDILVRQEDLDAVTTALEKATVKVSIIDKAEHGHGHLLAYVYSQTKVAHEDAPHVEIWIAKETKKMQRSNVTFPLIGCALYGTPLYCPGRYLDVLHAGYGPTWSTPCKAKSSNCKT